VQVPNASIIIAFLLLEFSQGQGVTEGTICATVYGQPRQLIAFLKGGWVTHKFTPFDPVSKRITAEVEKDGRRYIAAKGAPNAYGTIYFCSC